MKAGLLLVAVTLAGCGAFDPDGNDYTIKVDSVVVPGAVSGGAAFTVRFYGMVGPSGCYRFKEFRVDRSAGSADVTLIGHYENALCTQALVFLDGEPLTVSPPVTDPFTLRVHQPDKTVLTTTIRAE